MKSTINCLALITILFLVACNNNSDSNNNPPSNNTDTVTTTVDTSKPQTATPVMPTNLTGTYTWGDQESEDGGGYLAIEKQENDSLKFELDINNGAPNFHSGSATGMMVLDKNMATFSTSEFSEEDPCRITFTFEGNTINVVQEKGSDFACGFGQGVVASGTYTKQKEEAIFKYEGGL